MKLTYPGFMALGLLAASLLPAGDPPITEHGTPAGFHTLAIGDRAPDFSLLGTDGKTYSLDSFKDDPVLIVIFLSNHCPVSHAAETRFIPFVAGLQGKGVGVIAINPNSAEGLRVEELGFSKYGDTYEEMKLYGKERGFNFPYCYDGGTQVTAKAYGCLCTPHMFVFDKDRRLRYAGRFDDSQTAEAGSVHSTDGANAVAAVLAGQPVPVEVTRPMGCSTKWATKRNLVAEGNEAWKNLPVSMDRIDAAGIAALAKNPTGRLRVINLWATWCVPCVEEFPGLVLISRRLEIRDFDLITISVDDAANADKALAFLQKEHAAVPPGAKKSVAQQGRSTNNFLYTGGSADALAQALDSKWPGGYPYTVVIAPGGEILARYAGGLDVPAFQASLVERLGVYYTQNP
jgi:thiol-disulfide isomerase/thioredoxin